MRALAARLAGRRVTGLVQRRADIRFPLPDRPGRAPRGPDRARASPAAPSTSSASSTTARSCSCISACPAGCCSTASPRPARAPDLRLRRRHAAALRRPAPVRHARPVRRPSAWPSTAGCAHLGLEPLDPGFDGRSLAAALAGRRTALKVALMDQRLVVGVGNIYASESLFRARLVARAGRRAACVPREAARLAAAIRAGAARGDRRPAARRLRDYVQSNGELGNFQRNFRVYDRAGEPCLVCGGPVAAHRPGRAGDLLLRRLPALSGRPIWPLDGSAPASVFKRPLAAAQHRRRGSSGGVHGLRDHPGRAPRRRRPDHAQPAQGAERAERRS